MEFSMLDCLSALFIANSQELLFFMNGVNAKLSLAMKVDHIH